MKIRPLTQESFPKAQALLRQAFPGSNYETRLFENLHKNNKPLHEWVCIHSNKVIAYIAYTMAFDKKEICGPHLAPIAVTPEWQNKGIGSELLRFSLRQPGIKTKTIYVLGSPEFYKKFGFSPCPQPVCPFDKKGEHFLSLRNNTSKPFTVGYEPEFFI